MHDQPDRPLDRAIYWIEYVIRHRGAAHLQSKNKWMSLFQRALMDVFLIFLVSSCLIIFLALKLVRLIRTALRGLTRGLLLEPASNQGSPVMKKKSIPGKEAKSKSE